jgi:hypothetical protein
MLKHAALAVTLLSAGGCASASAVAGNKTATTMTAAEFDSMNSNMVSSVRGPLDFATLEGVWNDASESTVALVHREGTELRLVIAVGDTRPNIPLTMFEVTDMGNHLPGPEDRARATRALTTWRSGVETEKNAYLWVLAGKNVGKDVDQGSWADGNKGCENTSYWGNYTLFQQKAPNGTPVLMVSLMASKQKFGGGMGGQDFEFSRIMYFMKSKKPIPPAILERMTVAENFCRKTAGE